MKGPRPPMGGGNMGKLLKQAQKMQMEMAKAQEAVANLEIEASAGGGSVTAKVNGQMELLSLKINPEAVDPEDVEMLEDLIIAAVNNAMKEMRIKSEEAMAKVTGGLGGMGLPGMPF